MKFVGQHNAEIKRPVKVAADIRLQADRTERKERGMWYQHNYFGTMPGGSLGVSR